MYSEKQIERILGKFKRLEEMLEGRLFEKVDEMTMAAFPTDGSHHAIPAEENFSPMEKGARFEGEGLYVWMKGAYTVPEALAGKDLFIWPRGEAYEGMLWVNGKSYGNYATKYEKNSRGNHYCDLLKQNVQAGETIQVAIEFYAGHYVKGTQPLREDEHRPYIVSYEGVDICLKSEELADFYYNLKIANQMAAVLDKSSFRRAEVVKALLNVHSIIYYDFDYVGMDVFMEGARKGNEILKKMLSETNSASAPYVGLVGHSHMDTSWLWTRKETEKKCARTYANQMNLMDQYPDYTFVQSSACHSDMMKRLYPDLFEDIKKQVAAGRYEPNGGVWIECDCNIPSGESMVRQFLWGQRFTRENFDYTSDSFWLPDTFGYSAALPQIMKESGIKYFLTTKMSWNDTNQFPYDTFRWKGIDGSEVLVHLNRSHLWPDPENMDRSVMQKEGDTIKEREVSNMKLFAYGYGDGGGGPQFEMIEMADRLTDVEGLPRASHTTVSQFMQDLESTVYRPSTYSGELYLELHRGTLTNQHNIKRNNRKAEFALRDLEYLTVRDAVIKGAAADSEEIRPMMADLLVNQFHDTLPGTCIPEAHDDALREVGAVIAGAAEKNAKLLEGMKCASNGENLVSVINTLPFERNDVVYLPYDGALIEGDAAGSADNGGYRQQVITDLNGEKKLAVAGISIPSYASVVLKKACADSCAADADGAADKACAASAFAADGSRLETPVYSVIFNEKGYIESLIDKKNGRQLRGEGYALNTFLIAEDVSLGWDNWDIDADCEEKFADTAKLISREVVSDGAVEYRIRSRYQLTEKSSLVQDMIFYADSMLIGFETKMDWQDDHRFLKTAFDTTIHTDYASQEIQFGYIRRTTNRNTVVEKAKFEVSNHKYTDLSESRYGAAMLNDCKYGISIEGGAMRLSLHKGGCMPDYRGDKGLHDCTYGFLPHAGSMSAENVIRPAYEINEKPLIACGKVELESFLSVDSANVIAETIKPAEDAQKAFILRLYEAEGTWTAAKLSLGICAEEIAETNMLEETKQVLGAGTEVELTFKPFEIKTLLIRY